MDIFKKHRFFIGSILIVVLVLLIARNYQKSSNQMIGKVKTPATGSVKVEEPDYAEVQDPTLRVSLEAPTGGPVSPIVFLLRVNFEIVNDTKAKLQTLAFQIRYTKEVQPGTKKVSFILTDYKGNPVGSTVTPPSISSTTPTQLLFTSLNQPMNSQTPNSRTYYLGITADSPEFFDGSPYSLFLDKSSVAINPFTQKTYHFQVDTPEIAIIRVVY